MLNVPTMWTAFVVNFLALGLIWAYVVRSYPAFEAARFWTGSAFAAALGTAIAMLSMVLDSLIPLLAGGTVVIFASCLAAMGIKRFYDQPVTWRGTALITGLSFAGMAFFLAGYDSATMRILVYTVGQSLPLALTLRLLLSSRDGRVNPGARLAGIITVFAIGIYAFRAVDKILRIGGDFSFVQFNLTQSIMILALMDDLTGVGNRRHLLQRLTEACARSERSNAPFALLVIDLDGFKAVNDTHGHAAGDACLQHFTLMAQTRLRRGDMLARTGGDEFCIVLPASTQREGAMIARRVLEVCREDAEACVGGEIPIALSIGVAQWTREIGVFPDRLMAAADHALYAAKNDGKNRHAVYDPAPPPAPAAMPELALRKLA